MFGTPLVALAEIIRSRDAEAGHGWATADSALVLAGVLCWWKARE